MQPQRQHAMAEWRASPSRPKVIQLLRKLLNKNWGDKAQPPTAEQSALTQQLVELACRGARTSDATHDGADAYHFGGSEGAASSATERTPTTTLVVRNLPDTAKNEDLLELWPCDGGWDFLYLPMRMGGKSNLGFAFINFTGEEHAAAFASRWHGVCLPTLGSARHLKVVPAAIQGLEANILELKTKSSGHMRARRCDPIIVRGGRRLSFGDV